MLFEIFKAIIFGIVEGICEWLPISSTGHLILLEEFLSLDISNDQALNEQFANMFDVVIQLGAVLAIAVLYFKKFDIRKKENITLWKNIIIATLPAAIIGFAADKICEKIAGVGIDTLPFNPKTVATALIIYGILFIAVEKTSQGKKYEENVRKLGIADIDNPDTISIYPKDFDDSGTKEEFIEKLPQLDKFFSEKIAALKKEGKVLRMGATIENGKCSVGMMEVDSNHPLYVIKGGENAFVFHTARYTPIPMTVRGYGAGAGVTAAGVFGDILRTVSWNLEAKK